MKRNLPNALSLLRLAAAVALLRLEPLSSGYFVVFTLAGLTDALDGFLARRWGVCSQLGARLDSVGDLFFYGVMLFGAFPVLRLRLPTLCWYGVAVVLLIRAASYITGAVKFKCFTAIHTYGNKATGFLLFLLPYVMLAGDVLLCLYAVVVIAVAGLSSLEEWLIHLRFQTYQKNRRTLLRRPMGGEQRENG